jgi:hypothetical protein
LRSPWHRNFITGTTAWAMLMSGGVLVITQFYTDDMHHLFTAVIIAPGLLLAVITQFFWNRDRKKFDLNGSEVGPYGDKKPSRVRAPRQVRRQHRRGSRPGRSSRHPH